jgi:exopolysaccharide biosynthesis polyprenyl glycosylphosphotransferase
MLKEYNTFLHRLMMLADILVIVTGFLSAYYLRNYVSRIDTLSFYLKFLPLFIIIWVVFLYLFGMYKSFRTEGIPMSLFTVFGSASLGFVAFGFFLYALKVKDFSRSFAILIFLVAGALLVIKKIAQVYFFRQVRKQGFNYRSILIVGSGKRSQHLIKQIKTHSEFGFKIIGLIDRDKEKIGQTVGDYQIIGSFENIPEIVNNRVVDEVIFVVPRSWLNEISSFVSFLEIEGIRTHIAVDYFDLRIAKSKISQIEHFPLVTFETAPSKLWSLLLKRIFDLVFSSIFLVAFSPLFIIIGLLIKLTSQGPIFFKQQRVGLNGRKFTLYKFRTMEKDAEAKLKDYLSKNEMSGPAFKMTNDPRVTKVGKWLRKFSLDEFPQFWNVFNGEMSLVGPRPPLPTEVKAYDSWHRRRLSMRPGVTCLWQVNGRNKIVDFDKWIKLDLEYIDNWSLTQDFKILFRTVPAVLFTEGAK